MKIKGVCRQWNICALDHPQLSKIQLKLSRILFELFFIHNHCVLPSRKLIEKEIPHQINKQDTHSIRSVQEHHNKSLSHRPLRSTYAHPICKWCGYEHCSKLLIKKIRNRNSEIWRHKFPLSTKMHSKQYIAE